MATESKTKILVIFIFISLSRVSCKSISQLSFKITKVGNDLLWRVSCTLSIKAWGHQHSVEDCWLFLVLVWLFLISVFFFFTISLRLALGKRKIGSVQTELNTVACTREKRGSYLVCRTMSLAGDDCWDSGERNEVVGWTRSPGWGWAHLRLDCWKSKPQAPFGLVNPRMFSKRRRINLNKIIKF
jgi:hypothetical protein